MHTFLHRKEMNHLDLKNQQKKLNLSLYKKIMVIPLLKHVG